MNKRKTPTKVCPNCEAVQHAAKRKCTECGCGFIIKSKPKESNCDWKELLPVGS